MLGCRLSLSRPVFTDPERWGAASSTNFWLRGAAHLTLGLALPYFALPVPHVAAATAHPPVLLALQIDVPATCAVTETLRCSYLITCTARSAYSISRERPAISVLSPKSTTTAQ